MTIRGTISDMCDCSIGTLPIEITFEEFKEVFDKDALLIDCRIAEEHEKNHIDSSILLPMQQLSVRIQELEQHVNSSIYIYCRTGNRSCTFARYRRTIGYAKSQSITGGFDTWGERI